MVCPVTSSTLTAFSSCPRRDHSPLPHPYTPDATPLLGRDRLPGGPGAPPRPPPEPLSRFPLPRAPTSRTVVQPRQLVSPPLRRSRPGPAAVAPCTARARTGQPCRMRPPNSSPTGSDLAPHRPDPKLLAALTRQHRRRFAPGHGITALLPSCGKARRTRTGSRPRLGHRRSRVPPCRNLLPSLHPLYWASVGVDRSTASLPRAPGRRPLTRECIPPDSAFPPRLRPAGLGQGHCVLTPPVASSARTPDLQRWNPGACAATGQEAEDRQAGAPGSRIAQSRPAPTGLVSGARGDSAAAGTERATACPSSSGSSPLQGR
jgi:hypothetical protein